MLLEDFINRHRNANRNRLVFPHVIVPILMITGLVIFVVGFGLSLVCSFMNVMESVFNPKFALMSTLAGLGLTVGCLFVGALWGLVKEGRSGFRRSNYETLMLMYILILSLTLPFPVLIIGKFFYHYPVVRYPAYEMVVKPTPELEREIERFGLAKIKWHTPYDYSLDRQVIRYEFLESEDWYGMEQQKKNMLSSVVQGRTAFRYLDFKPNENTQDFLNRIYLNKWHYPEVIDAESGRACAVRIFYKEKPASIEVINLSEGVQLRPVRIADDISVYYDMSKAFEIHDYSQSVCMQRSDLNDAGGVYLYDFWVAQLMLPYSYQFLLDYKRSDGHVVFDFSFKNLLKALDKLS